MVYINIRDEYNGNQVETIDEFETYKEGSAMLKEYRMSDGRCYMSTRSTKEWRNRNVESDKAKKELKHGRL